MQRFEALQARYPGEGRVETRLEEARRQRDIDAWSAKAEAAAAEGDWDTAVTALENLTGLTRRTPTPLLGLSRRGPRSNAKHSWMR